MHRAWDAGFYDAITRLDRPQAQVDEATRLTRVLITVQRRQAPH